MIKVKIKENIVRRTFTVDVDPSELVWHMDREDRVVKVLEGASWYLQMDNELPTKKCRGASHHLLRTNQRVLLILTDMKCCSRTRDSRQRGLSASSASKQNALRAIPWVGTTHKRVCAALRQLQLRSPSG